MDIGIDFIELWLMAMCDHHIIANSTYSFWGICMRACISTYCMTLLYRKPLTVCMCTSALAERMRSHEHPYVYVRVCACVFLQEPIFIVRQNGNGGENTRKLGMRV